MCPSDHESLGYAAHLVWRNPQLHDHPDTPTRLAKPPPAGFGARRVGPVPAARGSPRSTEFASAGRIFRRRRRRLRRATSSPFPNCSRCSCCRSRTPKLVAGGVDRPAYRVHRRRSRSFPAHWRCSYNINIIGGSHPTRSRQRRHPQRRLCLPARRLDPRAGEAPSDAERAQRRGTSRAATRRRRDPDRLRPDRRDDLLRLANSRNSPGTWRPGRADPVRAVLHRRARGYLRVRYCCQARAIENQCYVVLSGIVGNLPGVEQHGHPLCRRAAS